MKSLIIGGNGFIGSHLVDSLLAAGDQVRVLDKSVERYRAPLSAVDYYLGLFSDSRILAEVLVGVDIVYHLACTTVPGTSNMDPAGDVQDNLMGTLSLLDQMHKNKVKRIVFLSSGGTVYGNSEQTPVSEEHPLRPLCSYGVVKVAIEKYLYMYQELYGFSPVILRPSNPFGPRQGHLGVQGLIATFLFKALKQEPFIVWGDGNIVRDYLYINDLVELIRLAGYSKVEGTFNAASGTGYSVNEVINIIREVTGLQPAVSYQNSRAFDIQNIVLDIKKAQQFFNWSPKTSLTDGIIKQWDWMKIQLKQ
jgi:UDP-glucose 4-epimerase